MCTTSAFAGGIREVEIGAMKKRNEMRGYGQRSRPALGVVRFLPQKCV